MISQEMKKEEISSHTASGNAPEALSRAYLSATQTPDYMLTPPPMKCWNAPPRRRSGSLSCSMSRLHPAGIFTDGLTSKEARKAKCRLASLLAARMSLPIVRFITLLLRGNHNLSLHDQAPDNEVVAVSHEQVQNK
ncbi:hypothetical protein ACHAW6_004067 [Cyclotella cf. meneghiniana]